MNIEQVEKKLPKSIAYLSVGMMLFFAGGMLPFELDNFIYPVIIILAFASIIFSFLLFVEGLVEIIRCKFEWMSHRAALMHVMGGISFFLGLVMFMWFHGADIESAKWYQYYFIIMPFSAYGTSILVMLTHPFSSFSTTDHDEE